ncbi:MAG TPA: MAPEG family protein [Rhodospirillales bacterium]|nr:MAPEG family protein [Rhodospirillales bacterium]
MPIVNITALYAAALALILLVLSVRVIAVRRRLRVAVGDAGDDMLARRIRAQGNFTEYVPLALILMLAGELAGAPAWMLHALGSTLVIGRITHAWSLSAHSIPGRTIGMTLTFVVLVAGAVMAVAGAVGDFTT